MQPKKPAPMVRLSRLLCSRAACIPTPTALQIKAGGSKSVAALDNLSAGVRALCFNPQPSATPPKLHDWPSSGLSGQKKQSSRAQTANCFHIVNFLPKYYLN